MPRNLACNRLTVRFFKGIFNSRPPAPRYSETWDVNRVLLYIRNLPDNDHLSLQSLTHKLAMLFALSNADRSRLASLDLRFRSVTREGVKFVIPGLTKTRRGGPPKKAFYPSFTEDRKLSPVVTLNVAVAGRKGTLFNHFLRTSSDFTRLQLHQ